MPVEIDSDKSEGDNTKLNIRDPPNGSVFSELLRKTLGSLMCISNSLRIKSTLSGAAILGFPQYTLGGEKLRIDDNIYELSLEIHKTLSSTGYSAKTVKNEKDILMMNNFINVLGYAGIGDKPSRRKTFFTITLPKIVEVIQK